MFTPCHRHRHRIRSESELRGIHRVRMGVHRRPGNLRTRVRLRQSHRRHAHRHPVRDVRLFAAVRAPGWMFRGLHHLGSETAAENYFRSFP